MLYAIPNAKPIEINTIILDLNGTLTVFGQVVVGAKQRINQLREKGINFVLFTGDVRGTAKSICNELGIDYRITHSGAEKERQMLEFNKETTAAIGNGRIDIGTFKQAKIAIATLQGEGIHTGILPYVDIIVPSINDALDLFIDGKALIGSLRE